MAITFAIYGYHFRKITEKIRWVGMFDDKKSVYRYMNKYLLASGTLSVLLAVAHTWWGFANIYSEIAPLDTTARASLEGSFHQVGATLFVGGLAFLIQGFRGYFSRAVPILILAIYSVNFIVGLLIVLMKYPALVSQTVPQLFLYTVMFLSLGVGIMAQKGRSPNPALNPTRQKRHAG